MKNQGSKTEKQATPLRIIPFYTGVQTLKASLEAPKSRRLLYLEILLNGNLPWDAYEKIFV